MFSLKSKRCGTRSLALAAACMTAGACLQRSAGADVAIDILARTGDAAPSADLPGGTYAQFSPIAIGDAGHVLFTAQIGGAAYASRPTGYFLGLPGEPRLVYRSNLTPAPGFPAGTRVLNMSIAAVDALGNLAFLAPTSAGPSAVFLFSDGALSLGIAPGTPIPGLAGRTLASITELWFLSGRLLVAGQTDQGRAVSLMVESGQVRRIVADVTSAAAIGPGLNMTDTQAHGLTADGRVLVSLRLTGTGINLSNDRLAAHVEPDGSFTVIQRDGWMAPGGFPAGALVSNVVATRFSSTAAGGNVLEVQASGGGITLDLDDRAMVADGSVVARTNQLVPGELGAEGVRLVSLLSGMRAGDAVAWSALLAGPGISSANDSGSFVGGTLVLRESDPVAAPAPAGARILGGAGALGAVEALNTHRDWAKRATLTGGGLPGGTIYLLASEANQAPFPLFYPGQTVSLDASSGGDDLRTVSGFRFASGVNEGGRSGLMNDRRELLASLIFADLTHALVRVRFGVDANPGCPADFNGDHNLDPDDLGDFINCFFSQPACAGADFNSDGNIDPDDLGDFINAYFGGCA
ncbi:MAG: hypothetical protein AB7K52_05485 [Phycisphaerales bacterium]